MQVAQDPAGGSPRQPALLSFMAAARPACKADMKTTSSKIPGGKKITSVVVRPL
jgi:hypothetical protein